MQVRATRRRSLRASLSIELKKSLRSPVSIDFLGNRSRGGKRIQFTKDLKQLKENQILAAKLVTGLEFEQARKTILRLM
jgi:hypothetical protein